jgi:hypothetical protein
MACFHFGRSGTSSLREQQPYWLYDPNGVWYFFSVFPPLLPITAFAEESKLSGIELILSTLALAALLVQAPDAKLDKLRE